MKLLSVFVLTRHGSRTPCHADYCMDVEFKSELVDHPIYTFTPIKVVHYDGNIKLNLEKDQATEVCLKGGQCTTGQLVTKGAIDQYELGVKLRKSYIEREHFLAEDNDKDIFVMSSRKKRAVESTRCILAGLFSNQKQTKTIPVHVGDVNEDIVLPRNPHTSLLIKTVRKNPDVIPGLRSAIEDIKADFGKGNNLDVSCLWDSLKTLKELGLCPPLDEHLWNLISAWGNKWFTYRVLGPTKDRFAVLRLASGMLVDFILSKMEKLEHNSKSSEAKFFILSGHDSTLWCFMHVMGIMISSAPPTNSALILEVCQAAGDEQKFVKVIYNDKEAYLGKEPATLCSLKHFMESLSQYRLTKEKYHLLCQSHADTNLVYLD